MPEYLKSRCCMCPQKLNSSRICLGIPGTPHPDESPCRFVKVYQDKRGWRYFVRSGIGANTFKTFYQNPKQAGSHGWRPVSWRDSFDEAQTDLNREAEKRGWEEVNDNPA